jgi:hypothetical protein
LGQKQPLNSIQILASEWLLSAISNGMDSSSLIRHRNVPD